ncbi:hypothetical protein JOF56_004791 [Kibdelosporangium banguiense]|uniref:YbaB/EbfC DNA-binding family protein n=1 Tax=Kibdelosporangium banguiense TaxID=1365924 RepID=A0ABS4TJ07_9PSEU|nr:YbaB/EbfC family nucleoid-associated protein [Kibdelosporangium banguiense]MBP2324406.1 hypothetical protein [Kibdelosporangium banguiense]
MSVAGSLLAAAGPLVYYSEDPVHVTVRELPVPTSSSGQEIDRRLAEMAVSATAPRQIVTITVGQYGQVIDVQFPSGAYRTLPPADLASALIQTLRKAQARAREEVAILMAPMTPPHFDATGAQLTAPTQPDESGIFQKTTH